MEHLVDLSFRYEDRLELVRSVCNPGSTFSRYLNLNPVILLSTLPGPFIPKVFLPEDSFIYFRRLDNLRPFSRGFANTLKLKAYKYRTPVFIEDIARWFHGMLIQELYALPSFVGEDVEAYKTCLRHFSLPYPKPSRDDVFSLTRDRLYDVLSGPNVPEILPIQNYEPSEPEPEQIDSESREESGIQSDNNQPVMAEVKVDEEGRQQVQVTREAKRNLDTIFRKITEGKF